MEKLIELAEVVKKAWYDGRAIIPLVGAGLSVDSGMPALQSIVRYVAKLDVYLKHGLYLPLGHADVILPKLTESFKQRPWEFLTAFGWPDRFQLNFDVRRGLQRVHSLEKEKAQRLRQAFEAETERRKSIVSESDKDKQAWQRREDEMRSLNFREEEIKERGYMALKIGEALDALARQINPGGTWHLSKYKEKLRILEPLLQQQDKLSASEREALAALTGSMKRVDSFLYQVSADWKPLLREITGHKQELIDALFGRLARYRRPGLSHQILTHLCKLLRIRTILTFNFDPLIEMVFTDEHLPHRIFSMEYGSQLPSLSLLDESVSVIKMHGSTHNILVDERVDYRISNEYRQSFQRLVGYRPLLLVLGNSGNDRRLRELVRGVIEDPKSQADVAWLYRAENKDVPDELTDPARLKTLATRPNALTAYPTFDVGQSLRFVYSYITERLATGHTAYSVHSTTPLLRRTISEFRHTDGKPDPYEVSTRSITVFAPKFPQTGDAAKSQRSTKRTTPAKAKSRENKFSCHQLLQAMCRVSLGYSRIWVDLEEHHSIGQVTAEIISQVRRGDATLNAFVSPVNAENAALRVARALRRSRYVLVIANIDAFTWRSTTHHGVTGKFGSREESLSTDLKTFLVTLCNEVQKDWQRDDSSLVLHFERPYARHEDDPDEAEYVQLLNEKIEPILGEIRFPPVATGAKGKPAQKQPREPWWTEAGDAPWSADLQKIKADDKGILPEWTAAYPPVNAPDGTAKSIELTIEQRLFLTALCCYRRNRMYTLVAQLRRDLKLGEQRDLLAPLASSFEQTKESRPFSWTEGGGLWCDRVWRDEIYDYFTRFTSERHFARIKSAKGKSREHLRDYAVAQLVIVAALHDLLARQYYLTAFLPSKDSVTCLEYLYHRIAALRYLAQLEALVRCDLDSSAATARNKTWTCGNRAIKDLFRDIATAYQKGPEGSATAFGRGWMAVLNTLGEQSNASLEAADVAELREHGFRDLTETWKRTEGELRRTLPSDQLISWCENILEYDLNRRVPSTVGPRPTVTEGSNVGRLSMRFYLNQLGVVSSTRSIHRTIEQSSRSFEESIFETLNKAYYERGDFERMIQCAELRAHYVESRVGKANRNELAHQSRMKHFQLDRMIAEHWRDLLGNRSSPPAPQAQTALLTNSDAKSEDPECWLRERYLYIERSLSFLSPVGKPPGQSNKAPAGDMLPPGDIFAMLTELLSDAGAAIEFAREKHQAHLEEPMRSPILEATADHGLFLPYRSLFQTLVGRIHTALGLVTAHNPSLATTRDDSKSNKPDSDEGDSHFRSNFVAAFRELTYARSGIGPENAILLAIADLSGADTALSYIRCLYECVPDSNWDLNGLKRLGKIDSKLRTASGYLSQATVHLAQAPHYVLVWRFLHAIQIQYHFERTMWNMLQALVTFWTRSSSLDDSNDRDRVMEGGRLLDRARRGLASIRNGLDYSSTGAEQFKNEWTYMWGRLGCAALAGALVRHGIAEVSPFRTFTTNLSEEGDYGKLTEILAECWVDLNISQGISPRRAGEPADAAVVDSANWAKKWVAPLLRKEAPTLRTHLQNLRSGDMRDFQKLRQWICNDAAYDVLGLGTDSGITID